MKKIILKYSLLIMLLLFKNMAGAQLPLIQGSVVITHSPYHEACVPAFSVGTVGSVVAVLDASNTSLIPSTGSNRFVWTTTTPINPKPIWKSKPNWVVDKLGKIFGITLDETGNIYVANTSIYGGEDGVTHDKIIKLDKTTGMNSVVFDYADVSGANTVQRGLGNLKLFKLGNTHYIAFGCWEDGKIYILKEPSLGGLSSTSKWTIHTSIKPNFLDAASVPYGIAVRPNPLSNGVFEIYYGVYNTSGTGHFSIINKIDIDNAANFISNSEANIATSGMPNMTTNYCTNNSITVNNNTPIPIADISFSSDYKRMVVGQQGLNNPASYQPHNSGVQEFREAAPTWTAIGSYPSGNLDNFGSNCPAIGTNSVGGVTYWNNILFQNNETSCDTTILYSTDLIYLSSSYGNAGNTLHGHPPLAEASAPNNNYGVLVNTTVSVYGFQGLPSNNSFTNQDAFDNSLKVDVDDRYDACDKWALGDIETFNVPLNCSHCSCGTWGTPTLGDQPIPGSPNIPSDRAAVNSQAERTAIAHGSITFPLVYTVSFLQGNVSGLFNIAYQCSGECGATFTWDIKKVGSATVTASGTNMPVDFAAYNNLFTCGAYILTVHSKCGEQSCTPFTLKINIVCAPPSCCTNEITVNDNDVSMSVVPTTDPNGASILNGTMHFHSTKPDVMEVRITVDEFSMSANSENCLLCKNRPQTWGNISSANFNGIPGVLYNGSSLPSPSMPVDNREVIFSNGLPISLNTGTLSYSLNLPAITDLECCEVTVHVCIKVTFKDASCKECVKMICGTYILSHKNDGDHDPNNPAGKMQKPIIFTPIN